MKRSISFLLTLVFTFIQGYSTNFPQISTDDNEVWYLIQFMNGGNAITASSNGAQISTSSAISSDEQLWKLTGDNTNGYTFTNKKGYILYVASAAKNQMVSASATPGSSSVTKFYINATTNASYSGGYEIQPVGNTAVSMNIFGGPQENRGVGLWDKADQNNPVTFTSAAQVENQNNIAVIPYPAQLDVTKEGKIAMNTFNAITYTDDNVKEYVSEFAAQLATTSGISLAVEESGSTAADGQIWLNVNNALPAEGYTLTVNDRNISIEAANKAGFFYALQTLKQLLPREFFESEASYDAEWSIPYVSITDSPALEHRGFMMDVARHFFDKDEVKKVLDIMALYKMNRLHWHLTDDQGWRVEIPEYPLLTQVGSIRSGSFTNPGDGTKFFDDTEYGRGMWFSQDDLREIVEYAGKLNIDILPEIDMPGHMVAAVTAYPEFSCDSTKKYSVRLDSGISQDVLNIGDDKVIDFLKCVLDNIAAIFPFPYIHIGGDECPTTQWTTNEDCLRRVQEEGLSGVEQLQSWLVEELGTYLKEKHGKDIVVWDELLSHWSSDNSVKPVIMAWNSIGKSSEAASKGFKSIVSPYSHLYLDFMQVPANQTLIDEVYYGGWGDSHVNTIEEAYGLNPVSSLAGREEYCMGVQGNLWAETLNDNTELEYQLLPRMLALSETGWLPSSKKSWASFYNRLQSHDEILDALGYIYAKHYIVADELTSNEQTLKEAKDIIDASIRGGVGYPSSEIYDALTQAYDAATADESAIEALQAAVTAYKNADITQPVQGKTYQIVSASTYYKKQFAGSTMYVSGDKARFHYTPQVEPEELWSFQTTSNGYTLKNVCSGQYMSMPTYNAAVTMTNEQGTELRIDKATVATRDYTYIPGVVTISAVSGYTASASGSVKRVNAELSGNIFAKNEPALCYPGTWYIVEVTDFAAQLEGLCKKCELIVLKKDIDEIGQPTVEAIEFLSNRVLLPAKAQLQAGGITESIYNGYVELYNEFLQMPRKAVVDILDDTQYYYIRNAYFTNYYAAYNSTSGRVEPRTIGNSDNYLWSIVKTADKRVYIYNKATGTSAYIDNDVSDQTVKVGKDYTWDLQEMTVDTGDSGICIIGEKGATSWYTNPDSWNYILTKPFWGGCIWSLVPAGVQVETGIDHVTKEDDADKKSNGIYDLQGRPTTPAGNNIYIDSKGKKILNRR